MPGGLVRDAALAALAGHLERMAETSAAVFGPRRIPGRDGSRSMTAAASLRAEAMLAGWLAATEDHRCPVGADHPAWSVLAELTGCAGPGERAELCLDLWAVMRAEVGAQAAEMLAALAQEYRQAAGGVR